MSSFTLLFTTGLHANNMCDAAANTAGFGGIIKVTFPVPDHGFDVNHSKEAGPTDRHVQGDNWGEKDPCLIMRPNMRTPPQTERLKKRDV